MNTVAVEQIMEAIESFSFQANYKEHMPWGNGHINDTFLVVCEDESQNTKRYILQRMNTSIFTRPVELMENIAGVTGYYVKL